MSPADNPTDLIGWLSSVVLFFTITAQVVKQWRSGTSRGVSRWLFLGQMTASTGFLVYSWLIGNWVFVVTNVLMLASAIAGLVIVTLHARREGRPSGGRLGGGERLSAESVA